MSAENSPAAKPRRRWLQFRLRTMLLGVAVFAFLLGMLVHFMPHLWWKLERKRMGIREVESVPTAPMPPADAPADWVGCRFGPLEFDLPRSMVEGLQTDESSQAVRFEDGPSLRHLLVCLPRSADWSTVRMSKLHGLSPAQFRLAAYEASSDDYHWTMNRKKLLEHARLLGMEGRGFKYQWEIHEPVEILFREDFEGLLSVGWLRVGYPKYPKVAEFEWYSTDGRARGTLLFAFESENADLTWVRAVCRSLRFSGEVGPDEVTGEELAELFEVVEPEE